MLRMEIVVYWDWRNMVDRRAAAGPVCRGIQEKNTHTVQYCEPMRLTKPDIRFQGHELMQSGHGEGAELIFSFFFHVKITTDQPNKTIFLSKTY